MTKRNKPVANPPTAGRPDTKTAAPATPKVPATPTDASKDVSQERMMAELAMSPIFGNAGIVGKFRHGSCGELSLSELIGLMRERATQMKAGDLSIVEDTLTAQAATLDAIFTELARRAAANMGEYLSATETYLRLALKAQAQCRTTLETLAEIKNPRPVAFVRQANIANGPQQVNNSEPSRAGKTPIPSNELLEADDGKRLDTGTQGAATGADRALATVDPLDRPADAGGQGGRIR